LTTPLSFVTAKPANIHTEFKQLEETRVCATFLLNSISVIINVQLGDFRKIAKIMNVELLMQLKITIMTCRHFLIIFCFKLQRMKTLVDWCSLSNTRTVQHA